MLSLGVNLGTFSKLCVKIKTSLVTASSWLRFTASGRQLVLTLQQSYGPEQEVKLFPTVWPLWKWSSSDCWLQW